MSNVNMRSASLAAVIIVGSAMTGAAQEKSPAAQATVQGPTNVNVVNVPTVTVGNTDLQPIPITDPLKQPVHANFKLLIPFGKAASAPETFPIPQGKRLVIEHFAARCRSSSQIDLNFQLDADDSELTYLLLSNVPFVAFPGEIQSFGTSSIRTIVDQGTVSIQVFRTGLNATSDCNAAMLGYLTPLQ